MESRFGHDFSRVRVHAVATAAESARSVDALAYTVGPDVVFDAGRYAPGTSEGKRLLAHELTHVIQQQGLPESVDRNGRLEIGSPSSTAEGEADDVARATHAGRSPSRLLESTPPMLQRFVKGACLPPDECRKPGWIVEIRREIQAEWQRERYERSAFCEDHPSDPRCVPRHAVEVERVLEVSDRALLSFFFGIFVDEGLSLHAYPERCDSLTGAPVDQPKPCLFVSQDFEDQAARFNSGQAVISSEVWGSLSRSDWASEVLRHVNYWVGHAEFETAAIIEPRTVCEKVADWELQEIAGIMKEFKFEYDLLVGTPESTGVGAVGSAGPDGEAELDEWFAFRIDEVSDTLKAVRCHCECGDVDAWLRRTVAVTTSEWSDEARSRWNLEMHKPKWAHFDLRWPLDLF